MSGGTDRGARVTRRGGHMYLVEESSLDDPAYGNAVHRHPAAQAQQPGTDRATCPRGESDHHFLCALLQGGGQVGDISQRLHDLDIGFDVA
jgi:hypothetical protein